MDKLTKIFFTFLIIIPLVLGYPGTTLAESDKKQTKIQIILELKKEITELGSKPVKRGIRHTINVVCNGYYNRI